MAELLLFAAIVVIALLAPAFGADSRDPLRGNRGDYPGSADRFDLPRNLRH